MRLEVLFSPTEFEALRPAMLTGTVCVVFDVLRATSSMVAALAAGAGGIRPVSTIEEALETRRGEPGILLAGERQGLRIGPELAGGVGFDFGNSPREFTADRVGGRRLAMTTTNGTRALRRCIGATWVAAGALVNLEAVAEAAVGQSAERILVVCGGTGDGAALEDSLAAGAFCDVLGGRVEMTDSARMAQWLRRGAGADLRSAVAQASNARRLLSMPELAEDVGWCSRLSVYGTVPVMGADGDLRVQDPGRGGPGVGSGRS